MSWIVVYTKPRQEARAKENVENLELEVSYPIKPIEKIMRGAISIQFEPFFPRYIFVHRNSPSFPQVSHALRNVRGVAQIVKFGGKYAELDDQTFNQILSYEKTMLAQPVKAYYPGDNVIFTHQAYRDIEAIYQEPDGEKRVILLFDLLNRPVKLSVPVSAVKHG